MTEATLIDELIKEWADMAPGLVKINHCILGTRVAIEVGDYFGFHWQPLAVNVAVFNQAGFDLFLQHIPVEDWPNEAYSLGVICENELGAKAWNGHVIVQASDYIFDMSGAQFHRPARGIPVDSPWVTPRPTGEEPWCFQRDGVSIVLWPRPDIDIYRRTKDWRTSYRPLAATLIRILKNTPLCGILEP